MSHMKNFAQELSNLIGWDGDPNNDETMELGNALLQLTQCKFKLTRTGITFIPFPKRRNRKTDQGCRFQSAGR